MQAIKEKLKFLYKSDKKTLLLSTLAVAFPPLIMGLSIFIERQFDLSLNDLPVFSGLPRTGQMILLTFLFDGPGIIVLFFTPQTQMKKAFDTLLYLLIFNPITLAILGFTMSCVWFSDGSCVAP